jgi:hypothetical protein
VLPALGRPGAASDAPLLNRRAEQLVGRVVPLQQGIVGGQGRVSIDDAYWQVSGPELPAGTWVRVRSVQGTVLVVRRWPRAEAAVVWPRPRIVKASGRGRMGVLADGRCAAARLRATDLG